MLKHLQHDQKTHGNKRAGRRAYVATYREARASGASVSDARTKAKEAATAKRQAVQERLKRMRKSAKERAKEDEGKPTASKRKTITSSDISRELGGYELFGGGVNKRYNMDALSANKVDFDKYNEYRSTVSNSFARVSKYRKDLDDLNNAVSSARNKTELRNAKRALKEFQEDHPNGVYRTEANMHWTANNLRGLLERYIDED